MKRLLVLLVSFSACTNSPSVGSDGTGAQSAAVSEELSLAAVQAAIAKHGAKWEAASTKLSALAAGDRGRMLGAIMPDADDVRLVEEDSDTLDSTLPAAFDWRNKDGQNFVSPVLDQGQCGSCVAFSAIGTFETQLNIAANDPSSPWQLSPQHLFSCGGGFCQFGWFGGAAARALVKKGVVDNACMPYQSGSEGKNVSCGKACADADSRVIKARSSSKPGSSIQKVKQALMNGPLMASMTVYDDFMFYKSGVYKHVTGNRAGGHEVSIVGWNDADGAWIVRNSWNTDWGMGGFFEIAYDDVSGVGDDTIALVAPTPGPYVAFDGLRDGALLSGTQTFEIDSQQIDANSLTWTLSQGGTQKKSGATATINTTEVADGVYELRPNAGSVVGTPHIVSILNGSITGAVAFQGLKEGQTLKGVEKIVFTASSSPVPLTELRLVVTDSTGAVVIDRATSGVAATNSIQWNTARRPNGEYTVSIVGSAGTQVLPADTRHVTIKN